MTSPYIIDEGIQKLIADSIPGIPVAKSAFLPAFDLKSTPDGYVFYDISECTPYHSSEGVAEAGDLETYSFMLDVACVAHSNTQRKLLVTSVLSALQPIVAGRRTQLTAYEVGTTNVFINFLRLLSQEEVTSLKTGQSNPDLTMLVLSFSGKATS
jgi:hypothetical protein